MSRTLDGLCARAGCEDKALLYEWFCSKHYHETEDEENPTQPTPSNVDDELRASCIVIQEKTKLTDGGWKKQFGNEEGLYGFIKAQKLQWESEAQVQLLDELEEKAIDAQYYIPNSPDDTYTSGEVVRLSDIEAKRKELKGVK